MRRAVAAFFDLADFADLAFLAALAGFLAGDLAAAFFFFFIGRNDLIFWPTAFSASFACPLVISVRIASTARLIGFLPLADESPTIAPTAPPASAPTGPPTTPPITAPVTAPAVCFETGTLALLFAEAEAEIVLEGLDFFPRALAIADVPQVDERHIDPATRARCMFSKKVSPIS
ncbi:MAG TPA: hypothetical protein VHU84_12920 [Lacipirellulaceae bacterium]|nr:hypothetical protein [Lacipirellulaceae bacterium]